MMYSARFSFPATLFHSFVMKFSLFRSVFTHPVVFAFEALSTGPVTCQTAPNRAKPCQGRDRARRGLGKVDKREVRPTRMPRLRDGKENTEFAGMVGMRNAG